MANKKKMATGPLTNVEKEYIMKNASKGAGVIAKKLKRREEAVLNYINANTKKPEPVVEEPVKKKKAEDFIMNNLLAKRKEFGVVVMTEAASHLHDENLKNSKKKEKAVPNYIHVMRKDDNDTV